MVRGLAVLLACAILLFGCAGSGGGTATPHQSSGAQQNTPAAQPNYNTGTGQQAGAPSQGAGQQAGSSSGGAEAGTGQAGAGSAQQATAPQFASSWKVAYKVTAKSNPGDYSVTDYRKGDLIRIDTIMEGNEMRIFSSPGKIDTCALIGAEWMCSEQQSNAVSKASITDSLREEAGTTYVPDGTMGIAGTTASCYRREVYGVGVRYCLSPEKILLYYEDLTSPSGIKMEATSYSAQVSDSDFTLPAQPYQR